MLVDPSQIDRSHTESYSAAITAITGQENGGAIVVDAEQFFSYQQSRQELNTAEGHRYYRLADGRIWVVYCHSVPIRVRHPRVLGKYIIAIIRDPELLRIPLSNMYQQSPMSFLIESAYHEQDLTGESYAAAITLAVMNGIIANDKLWKLFGPHPIAAEAVIP